MVKGLLRRFWALLGSFSPKPSLSTPQPHPVRLPDVFGGFRVRPGEVGGHPGFILTNKSGIRGFLFESPEGWNCCVYEHDAQPRLLSHWDLTPEAALVRFIDER